MLARFCALLVLLPAVALGTQPLQPLLDAAKPDTTVTLPPGIYDSGAPLVIKTPGITLDGGGKAVIRKLTAQAKGTSSLLQVLAPGVTVKGITLDSDAPAQLPEGQNAKINVVGLYLASTDITVSGMEFRNLDTGIMLYPGQDRLTVLDCHATNEMRGDFFYGGGGADNLVHGNVFMYKVRVDGSNQEHNLRVSSVTFRHLVCVRCSFRNRDGKECVAIRQGHGFRFYNCDFDGPYPFFLGEGATQPAGVDITSDFEIHHCSGAGAVNVRYANDVLVDDYKFFDDAVGMDTVGVADSDGSGVAVGSMERTVMGQTIKPYFRDWTNHTGWFKDLGGHSTRTLPVSPAKPWPATQPVK